MASFWSDYFKNKILDHLRGIATYTPLVFSHYALMTARPTTAGGGTAVPIPRLPISNTSAMWNAASAGLTTNKNNLNFVTGATADFGTVVGIAEYDASTGGNLLTYWDLTSPKTLLAGMNFDVIAGAGQFTYVDDVPPGP
jgi:hypothetical protein